MDLIRYGRHTGCYRYSLNRSIVVFELYSREAYSEMGKAERFEVTQYLMKLAQHLDRTANNHEATHEQLMVVFCFVYF